MNSLNIYQQLHKIGIVKSQYDFSRLCGRKKTWFSSIKSRNRALSVAALYILARNLQRQSQQPSPLQLDLAVTSAQVLKQLEKRCGSVSKRS